MSNKPLSDRRIAFAADRQRMVVQQIQSRGIRDPQILAAFTSVPRHEFVPAEYRDQAYQDRPLSIGNGQTISQPYVVAYMIELALLTPDDHVLDVGGGSGYQAALLAELGCRVTSVEIVPELARNLSDRMSRLGYKQVTVLEGDAVEIACRSGPFDAVISAAAPASVPHGLIDCLGDGGRLVLPVGRGGQELRVIEKLPDGTTREVNHGSVSFVPMTGNHV